jgi:hypothetical protein
MDLLQELIKAQDNLQDITFNFNGKEFKFYFRYLTLLEKVRIEQMSTKLNVVIGGNGTRTEKYEKQDHLIPIHTIIEKALDEDGKRLFSHTKADDFKTISLLPAGLASLVAYEMSKDIFGNMTPKADDAE